MLSRLTVYNNTGLASKASEEMRRESTENGRFPQPHCRLTPPPQGTTTNIPINLILPETRVTALHFAADNVDLSSFKFSWWAPKTHVF